MICVNEGNMSGGQGKIAWVVEGIMRVIKEKPKKYERKTMKKGGPGK